MIAPEIPDGWWRPGDPVPCPAEIARWPAERRIGFFRERWPRIPDAQIARLRARFDAERDRLAARTPDGQLTIPGDGRGR